MAEQKATDELQDIAGGWIQERKGTDVPPFLKFCYIVIGLGVFVYCLRYINGAVNNATNGALVRQFDAATTPANGFMYLVAGLVFLFVAITVIFAFRKVQH
jgi:hypothetical protein